jgi:hypothetical protein
VSGKLRLGLFDDCLGEALASDVQGRRQALAEAAQVTPVLASQSNRRGHWRDSTTPVACASPGSGAA